MKKLLKEAFQTGVCFGHSMRNGKPTLGLSFDEWYSSTNKNQELSKKIILALDDYGRKVDSFEYGLPVDPDTKDFEDKRLQEMLKIVNDILASS